MTTIKKTSKKPLKTSVKKANNKKQMLSALYTSLGVVSEACEKANITRATHYNYMNEDPDYKKAVEEIAERVLDFAESELFKQIREGSTTATIFLLKTKGKKRGYIERQEYEITQNGPDLSDFSKEEILSTLEANE